VLNKTPTNPSPCNTNQNQKQTPAAVGADAVGLGARHHGGRQPRPRLARRRADPQHGALGFLLLLLLLFVYSAALHALHAGFACVLGMRALLAS
jgi:hypothetical protein